MRLRHSLGPAGLASVLAAALVAATAARADAARRSTRRTWRPSIGPRAGLVLEPVTHAGPLAVERGRVARATRRRRSCCATRRPTRRPAAARRTSSAVDLTAGVGLGDRAAIGVDVPVFLCQDGTAACPPPSSSAAGAGALERHRRRRHPRQGHPRLRTIPRACRSASASPRSARVTRPHRRPRELPRRRLGRPSRCGLLARVRARRRRRAREPRLHAAHDATARTLSLSGVPGGADVRRRDPVVGRRHAAAQGGPAHARLGRPPVAGRSRFHGSLPARSGRARSTARLRRRCRPRCSALDDRVQLGHYRDAFVLAGVDLGLDQRHRRARRSAASSPSAGPRARTTATTTASPTTATSAPICPRTATASRTRTAAPRTTPTATASSTPRTRARSCPACGGTIRRRTAAPRPTPTATASPIRSTPAPR